MASLEMPAQEVGIGRRQKGADLESRTGRTSLEVGYETQMAWEDRKKLFLLHHQAQALKSEATRITKSSSLASERQTHTAGGCYSWTKATNFTFSCYILAY